MAQNFGRGLLLSALVVLVSKRGVSSALDVYCTSGDEFCSFESLRMAVVCVFVLFYDVLTCTYTKHPKKKLEKGLK